MVSRWLHARGGPRSASEPAAEPAPALAEQAFPETSARGVHPGFVVVPQLKRQVEFWKRIYGQYDTRQALVHDSRHIDLVYEVLQYGPNESQREINRRTRAAKARWREALLGVHRKQQSPDSWNADERHVFELFKGVEESSKFLNAAHRKRLRTQLGQKDRFREGYIASGRYMPHMEKVFREAGLPLELTRLPFVESSFNLKARSKVGASGIWQFMRSTGRLYLRIKGGLDERNDPIRATEAAARLLTHNHESLGNWPLAVTAYNHGRMGLMRAVRQAGSDQLADIIYSYKSRSFGFASSNFFACLLAAIDIERNAETYFGKLERDAALSFYEVELPQAISFLELDRYLKLGKEQIRDLNPGLSQGHWKGGERLPAGYRLRLPLGPDTTPERESRLFMVAYEQIPAVLKGPRVKTR
jgi:membrane-bound lytic murein transglycosylase D